MTGDEITAALETALISGRKAERAAIVAWLRRHWRLTIIADSVERGDHSGSPLIGPGKSINEPAPSNEQGKP